MLLRPKRSTLRSRSEVDLNRTFKFRHSKREWTGVPLILANMDTVGTFEMATEMAMVIAGLRETEMAIRAPARTRGKTGRRRLEATPWISRPSTTRATRFAFAN